MAAAKRWRKKIREAERLRDVAPEESIRSGARLIGAARRIAAAARRSGDGTPSEQEATTPPPRPESALSLDGVATSFSRACRQAGIDHVLVGGFSVVAWGQPRTTSALHVLTRFDDDQVVGFDDELAKQQLETTPRDLRAGLANGSHVSVFTEDPVLTVDVKPALEPREVDQIEAGREIVLDGEPVRVARPEDTVAFKIVFGSEQDRKDARSIVARQIDRLDRERLWTLAKRERVLQQARDLVEDVENTLEERSDDGDP